jgi:thiol-disulfide isomerase/thioredoxin
VRGRVAAVAAALAVVASLALAGCSSGDGIAGSYTGGDYTSGDGATTTFAAKNRSAPVSWTATESDGSQLTSASLIGHVVVLNFWYAQCGPCIAEAPRLQELSTQFASDGVRFVGVNVRDNGDQAEAFAKAHDVTYPTTIEQDGHDAPITAAFVGKVSTNTTPTTLVVDAKGRVAARFSGEITADQEPVLSQVIQNTVDETSNG